MSIASHREIVANSLVPQGQSLTTIEPDNEINDVCHVPNSGLVLMAMDHTTLLSYYIPVSQCRP